MTTAAKVKSNKKVSPKFLTGSDREWGYEFGEEGLFTDVEAAELLGCSRVWVWKLGKSGKIRRGKDKSGRWYYCTKSVRCYRSVTEVGPG